MRVRIRNFSKKARNRKSMNELKHWATFVAEIMDISTKIREIKLEYKNSYDGYYGNSPFQGFDLLWNGKDAKIIFSQFYDSNQEQRRSFIVHELTHVLQLISGDMEIVGDNREKIKWKGRFNHTWKKFRFSKMESLEKGQINGYLAKHFPWEKEVQINCDFFELIYDSLK